MGGHVRVHRGGPPAVPPRAVLFGSFASFTSCGLRPEPGRLVFRHLMGNRAGPRRGVAGLGLGKRLGGGRGQPGRGQRARGERVRGEPSGGRDPRGRTA